MEHHFEVLVRSLVGMLLPLFCVDLATNNGSIPAAGELIMLNRLLIVPGVGQAMVSKFVLARAEAQRVYGAVWESPSERTRITLKLSSCSH